MLGGALLAPTIVTAAPPNRRVRIGVIASGPTERWRLIADAVRAGLQERGYVEGRHFVLVERYVLHPGAPVAGRPEMDEAAETLLAQEVEVIVSGCGWSLRALRNRTRTVPIVMASVTDPVRQRFVESLGRPGGNITGVTGGAGGLGPKMLEQLRAALPEVRLVGVVYNASNPAHQARYDDVAAAARVMPVETRPIALATLVDEAAARRAMQEAAAQALLILPDDGQFWGYVNRIVATSDALRLPGIFPRRDLVEMGGLLSYGADDREVFRRTGAYVDRILNGSVPAELPVEHPKDTEFVVSSAKASRYGITIPRAALLRADHVIR
jgi:putative ABC transport system substrate-binding protein